MRVKHLENRRSYAVICCFIICVFAYQMAKAQTTTISVSPQTNTVSVGQTLTVNIEISNVQNLYGSRYRTYVGHIHAEAWQQPNFRRLDQRRRHPKSRILFVREAADQSTGEYNLMQPPENPAAAFSGSGTVATLTFTVTSTGQSL